MLPQSFQFGFLRSTADGCTLTLKVHPGAKRNAITGTHDGALKVSLAAPAVDGKANAALIAYLAEVLSLPRSRISLERGATARLKVIRFTGLTAENIDRILANLLAKASP